MAVLDLAKLVGFFAAFIGVMALLVTTVMRAQSRRYQRRAQQLAAGLTGATLEPVRVGRYQLTRVRGQRAGCGVMLNPELGARVQHAGRSLNLVLSIRGSRAVGAGTIESHRGALTVTGSVLPLPEATATALKALRFAMAIEGMEARVFFSLGVSADEIVRMLAIVDALGPYLTAVAA